MAFLHPKPPLLRLLLLTCASLLHLTSPTHSLNTCTSQNIGNNLYTNCTDLPTLNASLYYNHIPKTSSISIAFVAPPSKPDGWIAWAINPTQTGMAGSQALIAFKNSNGTMNVKTYNISSYSSIVEGKIAFEVSEARAEYSAGSMKIYATVKLPETMTEVNHVWQVGGAVVDGVPVKHEFQPENLSAKGKFRLRVAEVRGGGGGGDSPAGAPSISPNPNPNPSPNPSSGSGSGSGYKKSVMCVFLVVIVGGLILN
ncbi:putative DOMON domain-containing protein [Helianthus annuus]|nr:putative DOMON domain-containing protein [Helianthus annuus]KAJ0622871.1 putative DOMON domain-containing protein [Helianthus annuus]